MSANVAATREWCFSDSEMLFGGLTFFAISFLLGFCVACRTNAQEAALARMNERRLDIEMTEASRRATEAETDRERLRAQRITADTVASQLAANVLGGHVATAQVFPQPNGAKVHGTDC